MPTPFSLLQRRNAPDCLSAGVSFPSHLSLADSQLVATQHCSPHTLLHPWFTAGLIFLLLLASRLCCFPPPPRWSRDFLRSVFSFLLLVFAFLSSSQPAVSGSPPFFPLSCRSFTHLPRRVECGVVKRKIHRGRPSILAHHPLPFLLPWCVPPPRSTHTGKALRASLTSHHFSYAAPPPPVCPSHTASCVSLFSLSCSSLPHLRCFTHGCLCYPTPLWCGMCARLLLSTTDEMPFSTFCACLCVCCFCLGVPLPLRVCVPTLPFLLFFFFTVLLRLLQSCRLFSCFVCPLVFAVLDCSPAVGEKRHKRTEGLYPQQSLTSALRQQNKRRRGNVAWSLHRLLQQQQGG